MMLLQNGWTALAHASWYGHLDVVRYLVEEAKIQMNTKDKVRIAMFYLLLAFTICGTGW